PALSRFESLDAERLPGRGLFRRWEAYLALALLAPILLYGAWDWYTQATSAAAYRQGVAAQAARHWDAAQTAFAAAGGYQDAPSLRQAAAQQVFALAGLYERFQAAQRQGDWLTAWNQAQAITAIQPDYRDIATQAADARRELFGHGIAGTLYLEGQG